MRLAVLAAAVVREQPPLDPFGRRPKLGDLRLHDRLELAPLEALQLIELLRGAVLEEEPRDAELEVAEGHLAHLKHHLDEELRREQRDPRDTAEAREVPPPQIVVLDPNRVPQPHQLHRLERAERRELLGDHLVRK